jgi:uncharacterized protein (DUF4415 family)
METESTTADLTPEQQADLAALRSSEPDTASIPPASDAHWRYAGRFYQPRKEAISLRLDAEVLNWLRTRHERYQPELNRILRDEMGKALADTG